MEIIVLALILGFIPAAVAQSKGRNFVAWYVYGVLLWIVAIIHILVLPPNTKELERRALADGTMKRCSACAETVNFEARVCRHCGRVFTLGGIQAEEAEAARRAADEEAARIREASAAYAAEVAERDAEGA